MRCKQLIMLQAESTIASQKSRANNIIVLVEFVLNISSKNDFSYFWSANQHHALENLSGLNCQFNIFSCVPTHISFFQKYRTFLIQETVNALLLVFSGILFIHFFPRCYFKTSEKRGNVGLMSTTPSHCTLTADIVCNGSANEITAFALVYQWNSTKV